MSTPTNNVRVYPNDTFIVFEKDKTSDDEAIVYNPEYFRILGFRDAEISLVNKTTTPVVVGEMKGGKYDPSTLTFAFKEFVYMVDPSQKNKTSDATKSEEPSKPSTEEPSKPSTEEASKPSTEEAVTPTVEQPKTTINPDTSTVEQPKTTNEDVKPIQPTSKPGYENLVGYNGFSRFVNMVLNVFKPNKTPKEVTTESKPEDKKEVAPESKPEDKKEVAPESKPEEEEEGKDAKPETEDKVDNTIGAEEVPKLMWRIQIPIIKTTFELGPYEKEELVLNFNIKERRVAKKFKNVIVGEIYQVGHRFVRIGEVEKWKDTPPEKIQNLLEGTKMSKYDKFNK